MKDILSLGLDELRDLMLSIEESAFRASQIFNWVYKKRTLSFSEMMNLPKALRGELSGLLYFPPLEVVEKQVSKDGTEKFLWKLEDGNQIESVVLRHPRHVTFCISSQVGCALNCSFCATGAGGFSRNLSTGEIVSQVIHMERAIGGPVDNIVFMGMGEPFLNENSVYKAIDILHDPRGRNLGFRRFTISTAGIPEGIKKLADSGMEIRLSVSLHSAKDGLRSSLMPVNRMHSLDSLREALVYYQEKTGNRITFEYALISGMNDTAGDVAQLIKYLRGIKSFINLIPVNPVNLDFERPSDQKVADFKEGLRAAGFESAARQEKGTDIDAACGQLRQRRRG
ncbi:MAG: 23S rRNA (adenine(2503)-C(2))-methyltransferase RlmN [Kosmotogaceae bacterium]